ncbi:SpoIIE family protein phosphatase [Streptomyces sp. DK15]|uniref:SpoIIE family protein phosphatase n=1 Tax=Streptomyces sp. DK15 TaxID=2957499 RepID=UPI0029ADB912|nr:SpoIIE family protein phosphatase [Streptomyces sp. DK15]MDX2391607.1 SpoIIE family protein phosphatase [Streptomyces sp. DK15]
MKSDPALPGDGSAPEVLALARIVARLRAEAEGTEAVASTAAVLERAKGVLMAQAGVTADAAYALLLRRAEQRGRTLMEECWITLGGLRTRPEPPAEPPGGAGGGGPRAGPDPSPFDSGRYLAGPGRTAGERRPLLARLAEGLAGVHGADEVAELLVTVLGDAEDIAAVMIYTAAPAGGLELAGAAGISTALAEQWRHVPPLSGVAAMVALAGREPVWLEDPERDALRYRLIGDPPERWQSRAWVPVFAEGPATAAVGFFRTRRAPFTPDTRLLLRRAARMCAGPLRDLRRPGTADPLGEADVAAVQRILDALSGAAILLTPLRSGTGEVEDYRIDAAAPASVDVAGRRGKELVGRSVLETYPTVAGTDLWEGYLDTLTTGTDYYGPSFTYREVTAGLPRESSYAVRATRLGGRLVVSWIRLDTSDREARRLADMQRLGNLGWADWDLVTNVINWSDQVYVIFGRDPAEGPMPLEELPLHLVPEDLPRLGGAVRRLLGEGRAVDQHFRIDTADGIRHLRIVAEAGTDEAGTPVEVHGFFQDLSAQRDAELALRESERAVLVQRGMLQAERILAARLQHALLPLQEQSLELAGLCVDVAYLPSDTGVNVGGDWYSAIGLPDDSALFVLGDVAGHGLDAVGTMAQLRFTAKGMIVTGSELPDALSRLNSLLLHTSTDTHGATATMIMGRYRPWDRRLTWVRAGHLPPLLIRDGEASFLPQPVGALLGADFGSAYEQSTLDLRPDDHLLLYTDGLVEEPGEDIDIGLARLARTARRLVGEGHGASLARGLAALRPGHRDDICVMDIHVPAVEDPEDPCGDDEDPHAPAPCG